MCTRNQTESISAGSGNKNVAQPLPTKPTKAFQKSVCPQLRCILGNGCPGSGKAREMCGIKKAASGSSASILSHFKDSVVASTLSKEHDAKLLLVKSFCFLSKSFFLRRLIPLSCLCSKYQGV